MISKKDFLTKEYVESLIKSGVWCDHGSYLDEFYEDIQDSDLLPPELSDISNPWGNDDFLLFFKNWLSARFDYAKKMLNDELDQSKNESGIVIHRTIYCNKETIDKAIRKDFDIGRFWSAISPEAYCGDSKEHEFELTVTATASESQIDFLETMRSRMDYKNGDDEGEIYIKKGFFPKFTSLSYVNISSGDFVELESLKEERLKIRSERPLSIEP